MFYIRWDCVQMRAPSLRAKRSNPAVAQEADLQRRAGGRRGGGVRLSWLWPWDWRGGWIATSLRSSR